MDLTGGGDIWSTGAFSFESPLKDLLDGGEYTLEQLLAEDELLQELRGCHQKLIDFFSTEQAVTKLVQYVIMPHRPEHFAIPANNVSKEEDEKLLNGDVESKVPADDSVEESKPKKPGEWLQQHLEDAKSGNKQKKEPEKDPALKYIRFPYMACEIICCEIPGILEALVEGKCSFEDESTASDSHPEANEIIPNASQQDMMEVVPKEKKSILDFLFSLLHDTPAGELDDYRAGYFDKVLTVLFRKRPEEMTTYINTGGAAGRSALMRSLLKHLYSHSIMQIAQRLLLPQRPMDQQQQSQEGDEIVAGDDDEENEGAVLCDWSDSPEVLDLLLDTLIAGNPSSLEENEQLTDTEKEQQLDLSLNASEVLITIIQNSMLSSPIMLSLTSSETVRRVVDAATTVRGGYFSPRESLLTSAMNVLESLILQLGGYGAVGTMTLMTEEELQMQQQELREEEEQKKAEVEEEEAAMAEAVAASSEETPPIIPAGTSASDRVSSTSTDETERMDDGVMNEDQHLISDLTSLLEHLPRLLDNLSSLLRHPSTKTWASPTQFSKSEPQQLLGNSRLRIVRVLESLVLLGDPDVDSKLVQSDCLELCLDFFWQFQWCSMLHQSVANLLVHVFEGQNARYEMQEYFLVKCNLLGRLMDSFVEEAHISSASVGGVAGLPPSDNEARISDVVENLQDVAIGTVSSTESDKESSGDAPLPVSEDDVEAVMESENSGNLETAAPSTNVELVSTEAVRFESRDVSTVGDVPANGPAQAFRFGYMGHVIIICQALVHAYTNDPQDMTDAENTATQEENQSLEAKETNALQRQESSGGESGAGEYEGPKDDFGEPLLLFELVHTHKLAERWHEFVETTLAAETAVQSTPLGGYSMQSPGMDPMHSHRPGLAEDSYMMGDDGDRPPAPPRGMLGGGDVIDMDDNDLDIAASMMASLNVGNSSTSSPEGDEEGSENSGDSNRSYNSGETASDRSGYAFDDPLGKAGGLGIELGKLTQYKGDSDDGDEKPSKPRPSVDSDDGSHSSSDEEPEQGNDNDVPIMDLFAGNFNDENDTPAEPPAPAGDFADFAAFESAADVGSADDNNDGFGAFAGARETPSAPANDPFKGAPKPDLDDIFGEGDHADLLEQEDDEAFGEGSAVIAADEPAPISPEGTSADEAEAQSAQAKLFTAPPDESKAGDESKPEEDAAPPAREDESPLENGEPSL